LTNASLASIIEKNTTGKRENIMTDDTLKQLIAELSAVCTKYGVMIDSGANADDDSNLSSWIEILKVTKRPGRWPLLETVSVLDTIGTN
jgi:hypothetical protein